VHFGASQDSSTQYTASSHPSHPVNISMPYFRFGRIPSLHSLRREANVFYHNFMFLCGVLLMVFTQVFITTLCPVNNMWLHFLQ